MTLFRRVFIATIMGFICGLVCMALASSDPNQTVELSIKLSIVAGRTLMGFVIGISAMKMKWFVHGPILGLITSIPMAVPIMNDPAIFIGTFVMGIIYGFLVELVTTVVFREKQK